MEAKVVVGTKTGKSYNVEVKDDLAAVFVGKRVGDVVNVTPLGLKGYEVKITGGSDKQGFPIRKDAHVTGRTKAMMSTRTQGYKPEQAGVRVRKTVVGDILGDNISQINTVVVKEGKDPIDKLIGLEKKAEDGAAPKKEDPVGPTREERKAEEKPKEKKKEEPPKEEEPKPEEKPKEEKPSEDKPADKAPEKKAEKK